ncbi:hypothetical protein HY732_04560 [Candidatus Uhrbacteria bacterium]|nr:hypothetical protein [Candidatus Uhrbacteria bacterium]
MANHQRISDYIRTFIPEKKGEQGEGTIAVTEAASALAFYYEKIRNAMEYQDDHLIRQSAIRRILGRRIMFSLSPSDIAQSLVLELVRSRYLSNNSVPVSMIGRVREILSGYLGVLEALKRQRLFTEKRQDWLLHMASCALDELFVPMEAEEGLVRLMADVLGPSCEKSFPAVDERIRKSQLIIAAYRILLRPNIHRLNYFLLKQGFSQWMNGGMADADARAREVPEIMSRIASAIRFSLNTRMQGAFRRFRIAFIVLHSIVKQRGPSILDNPAGLEEQIRKVCEKMYATQRRRLYSRTIRAFIYIFLTKMIIGFAVEIPYDKLTVHYVKLKPLLINLLFPPCVLAAIAFTVRLPGSANTNEIVQAVSEIVYPDVPQRVFVAQKIAFRRRTIALSVFFNIIYGVISIFSIGLFAWVLHRLDFNIASGLILFFFLSLVMFFGITLRRLIRDLVILKTKESFFWLFVSQFFDPIMRLGQWLAFRISRINILVFVFDIIIELPFQALVDITEEWFTFLKEKKDDLEHR